MATTTDQWHLAAARISPLIWEVQKAQHWGIEKAKQRVRTILALAKCKDYVGILTSEPELESMRDRLVIVPVNYPKSKYKHPFLVERCREIEVYNWNGELEFAGEALPEQDSDFLRWCSGHFIRLVGLKPPITGP
ncbi:MAG: hypothetical protein AB1540_09870 [Bdellovibrionota bacterium]